MKYLELIKGQFTADHEARAKQLEPYVAYSEEAGGVMYTFIPAPVEGPANNEIWYTSSDGNIVNPYNTDVFGANIVSNTYENDKGVITFDGEVTSIGESAFDGYYSHTFDGYSSLTSVTIPNSVTSIGDSAFANCSDLTSITIPNSVTTIGNNAFANCSGLPVENNLRYADTYLVNAYNKALSTCSIKEGTKWIGSYAFSQCPNLTSITIPNSVTSIGDSAFEECYVLASIIYEGTQEQWNAVSKGDSWNYGASAAYVQCSDGQVSL